MLICNGGSATRMIEIIREKKVDPFAEGTPPAGI